MTPTPDLPGRTLDLAVMDQLLNLDDGELGLLKEMYGLFQEDTPDRIKAMEAVLGTGDLADLADLAHAVKGAAGTMGADRMRTVAADLEAGARQGTFAVPPAHLLAQLKETYAEALGALNALITQRERQGSI
jgi:HPt (histidine-containing phosphotransfer) domain-containing protein